MSFSIAIGGGSGAGARRDGTNRAKYTLLISNDNSDTLIEDDDFNDYKSVPQQHYRFPVQKRKLLIAAVSAVLLAAIIVGIVFAVKKTPNDKNQSRRNRAAVVTNGLECSGIASDVMRDGGSAADAAIAALICEGVTCPQSTGLGGGFVLTIFTKATGKVESLIARDIAPLRASKDMFGNETSVSGGKSITVPTELKGYWELHKKYGKLPWARLFQPTIELCRKGHVVSGYLQRILQRKEKEVVDSELRHIYVNPETNQIYQEGDRIKRLELANTLELIAKEGADTLYNNGTLAQNLVRDIRENGGIITEEDFMEYDVRWEDALSANLKDNRTLYTISAPGSGPLIVFMMNTLNNYLPRGNSLESYVRIAEVFKYAYAHRSQLADPKFVPSVIETIRKLVSLESADYVRGRIDDNRTYQDHKYYGADFDLPEDHGTANINVIAPNGDAVVATGTINNIFGSRIVSKSTGIILNDGMDDFSRPGFVNAYGLAGSPANFIAAGKAPLSSMAPTILLNGKGDVELLIGAAGGSKITSSIAYIISRYLYFNDSIQDAVNARRIHHQLIPMRVEYEAGLDQQIVDGLAKIGHEMHEASYDSGFSSVTAIACDDSTYIPVFDPRRQGSATVI